MVDGKYFHEEMTVELKFTIDSDCLQKGSISIDLHVGHGKKYFFHYKPASSNSAIRPILPSTGSRFGVDQRLLAFIRQDLLNGMVSNTLFMCSIFADIGSIICLL